MEIMQIKAFTWFVVFEIHCKILLWTILISAEYTNCICNARIQLVVIKFNRVQWISKLCQYPIFDFLNCINLLIEPCVIWVNCYLWFVLDCIFHVNGYLLLPLQQCLHNIHLCAWEKCGVFVLCHI